MLNFTLSNYFNAQIINNIFIDLYMIHPEILKEKISFNQISGTIPFNSWNGDHNINRNNNILLNPQLNEILDQFGKTIRLNCANILLEPTDFKDNYHQVMLDKFDNGSTVIEVSNLDCWEYLKNNYSFKKYILSSNASLMIPYTADIINTILDNTDFDLIQIPNLLRQDFDLLSKIKEPSRIEICVNPICPLHCANLNNCIIAENQASLEFSKRSAFTECAKVFNYIKNKNTLTLDYLHEHYEPLGITHFNLATCPADQIHNYLIFLINYFIDVEKHKWVLEQPFIQGISALRDPIMQNYFELYKKYNI